MPRRRIDPTTRETARALAGSGMSHKDIAAELNVARTTVTRWLGAARPQGRPSDEAVTDADVIRLRDQEHLSWRQVAACTGLSTMGALNRYRRAKGLPRPERGQA
jgi:orotate phosphoribosyltransferase-like protein